MTPFLTSGLARSVAPKWAIQRVALLAAGVLLASGCLEEAIEREIRRQAPAIPDPEDDTTADPVEDIPFEVNSVQPNRGPRAGGTSVLVVGVGFREGATVFFGNDPVPAEDIEFLNSNRLRVQTPPRDAGQVGVAVEQDSAREVLPAAFTYFAPVTLESVAPPEGFARGGTQLTVKGTGFVRGTTVQFGGTDPIEATLIDAQTLALPAPALAQGLYTVTVSNLNGSDSLGGAYRVYERVSVRAVDPVAIPIGTETGVRLFGTGFIEPSDVELGAIDVGAGVSSSDETELDVNAAPGNTVAEGIVDVQVSNANGADTLPKGLAFYDASNAEPRITGVMPDAGVVEGGGTVHIVGAGFADLPTAVSFGEQAADCQVPSDNLLRCTLPPNPDGEGRVDVRVRNATIDVTAAGAFEYIDLRLDLTEPAEGAIAGGSWVRLFGNGFGEDVRVFFGDEPAPRLERIDDETLEVWTPAAQNAGAVDVTIETRGLQRVREDSFTYFNPTDTNMYTHGAPIQHAVNITVLDGSDGSPLPEAFVMLDSEPAPDLEYASGFTNAAGQLTLSGPEVSGPIDVHALKSNYGGFSTFDAESRNLTMLLDPFPEDPPEPLPECPQAEGPSFPPQGAPLVRGTVRRIKDEFNTGNDVVMVTTTLQNLSVPLPNPGPGGQLESQGPYEIFTRTGDMVVVAMAGHPDEDGFLDVHALGFYPYLYTQASSSEPCSSDSECPAAESCTDVGGAQNYCLRVYDDIDIVIDTPLNQPLEVRLEDAPVGLESTETFAAPEQTYVRIWYDFDSKGVLNLGTESATNSDVVVFPMPRQMPPALADSPFHIYGQVYGNSQSGGSTWSEVRSYNHLDTTEPIVLEPVLPVSREAVPEDGVLAEPRQLAFERLPETDTEARVQVNQHYLYSSVQVPVCIHPILGPQSTSQVIYYWQGIAAGSDTDITLPSLPELMDSADLPAQTTLGWWISSVYVPEAIDFGSLRRNALYDWAGRSGRVTTLQTQ